MGHFWDSLIPQGGQVNATKEISRESDHLTFKINTISPTRKSKQRPEGTGRVKEVCSVVVKFMELGAVLPEFRSHLCYPPAVWCGWIILASPLTDRG